MIIISENNIKRMTLIQCDLELRFVCILNKKGRVENDIVDDFETHY